MVWAVRIFFLLGALLVCQSAWALADGYRFLSLVRRRRNNPAGTYTPLASVVIPCKGVDAGFELNLERFLHQDYPAYQVVFAVATPNDPVCQHLQRYLSSPPPPSDFCPPSVRTGSPPKLGKGNGPQGGPRTLSLVVAGLSDTRGEKVNNLLHGIKAVDHAAEVLVFADIDATPSSQWLRSLVAPLANPEVSVSTGFRWYLPGKGFVSHLRAAWDTSIATMMGDHNHNFAWGGSMAIRATDFRKLDVANRYWANTVSDDYGLTRAVREAHGKIQFEPRCLVASQEESSLWDFLSWSTRQIVITRVYAAHLWKLGLASYLFYCGTLALGFLTLVMQGINLSQRLAVAATVFVILLLGAGKGRIRSIVARELFPAESRRCASCYWQLSPLVPWIMLWNFIVAGFSRRIDWRGTEYELVSRDRVRVIRRTGA
jgi:ceramide glucosyltransferase